MARAHHDYQREGSPVGYYVPGMEPKVSEGNTIILCHRNLNNSKISEKLLLDDVFLEIDWEGNIVWKLGPDYDVSRELRDIGWIIGPHHAHIIPKGLPGEGNLLLFDNGGFAGYGIPNPGSTTGLNYARRDYSRVLEIDPITLEVVWQYTPSEAGCKLPDRFYRFYSPLISSAQRLPNGNTLITIGSAGILIEVTIDHDVVWEYISPFFLKELNSNLIYRAYRVHYDWVPQLEKPEEVPVEKRDVSEFSLSGRSLKEVNRVIDMADMKPFEADSQSCVVSDEKK